MEPTIIDRNEFHVAGVIARITRGKESPELFAGIWETFESYREEIACFRIGGSYYGVSFPTAEDEVFEYLAGMMVAEDTPAPGECVVRKVARATFAVFECPVGGIGAAYQQIFGAWLPGAAFEFNGSSAPFEEYPEDTSKHPVRIHIPVRRRI